MMRCGRVRLDLQALRGEAWAALTTKVKRNQPLRDGGRSRLSFQARVSKTCSGHPREHKRQHRQGTLCPGKHATALPEIIFQGLNNRLFSSSARDGDDSDEPVGQGRSAAAPRESGRLLGNRRRRAWESSLSPLERVSRLVHEEFLSPEVPALGSAEAKEAKQQEKEACVTEDRASHSARFPPQAESQPGQGSLSEKLRDAPSKNVPFQVGDLILAETRRRRDTDFKKLCKLTAAGVLNTSWGVVKFAEIIGKFPGQMFRTLVGHTFLIRRPALEEYVLLMKRGPTISYPKDINAMLLLMDISQGDTVLEVGSGSGGMSLFLSRAVGPQGHVISYEIRKDHYKVVKKNYQSWCDAWKISHNVEWPDNVDFINEDILTAREDLKTVTFDAIALDMVLPQNALSVVIPNLKQGGVCAVYLANITQVIDLMEAIRTSNLTLFCERIVEVTHRDWLVLPAMWRNGCIFQNMESKQNTDGESACHHENEEDPAEHSKDDAFVSDRTKPPYIARPYHWQIGHTAFLVKLRKFNPAYPNTTSLC
ncbi:tRNA (adenine(58)-N(1))-methyltransferase, mitochondrial isoform X2 [Rhineura floridana]|uniref:tRNA (adenine(58)-N(1))-methyltransferase, mitochondrial isoform X2 n=1 Tax=Rhineura floridana TaxID=261503 RepID=UPI002AC830A7|nr:tRNA (adenine(58)-N(1))-methyltransferase, mitochondrial isoform X2 [Rhineura floridana]